MKRIRTIIGAALFLASSAAIAQGSPATKAPAAPATAADVKAGASLRDMDGAPVGTIVSSTDQAVVDALAGKGHQLKLHEENSSSFRFARPGGIRVDPDTQQLTAGVHQFTPAWAMGY